MSLNYTTLFTRLGHAAYLFNSINKMQGTASLSGASMTAVGPGIDTIYGSYASPDVNLVQGLYAARDSYRGVHTTMLTYLQSLVQSTLIQMVSEAAPQVTPSLLSCLTWLVGDMVTNSQTVVKPVTSSTDTVGGSNVGTGVMKSSLVNGYGVTLNYNYAEDILVTCTSDSQTGITAGQEIFTLTSQPAETNPLLWDYPEGSGLTSATLSAVDATVDNGGGNLLQNGSFKQWTNPSVGPDNWKILVGTVGTQIVQATGGNVYKGTSGLAFVGDSSTLTSITQPFDVGTSTAGDTGGTTTALTPNTVYAINLAIMMSATPAAGVLVVDLTDSSNTIVNDAAATANSLTIALTGLTSSWTFHTIYFRTPTILPVDGLFLRLNLTTAISTGKTAYIGHLAMSKPSAAYAGGPYVAVFSGLGPTATPNFYKGDYFQVATANDYSSGWQLIADRLFGMKALGLQLPSITVGSETIHDALIA